MISLKRLSCLSAMLIMLSSIAPQPATAKSKADKAPGIVLFPVFYRTDREKDGETFGPAPRLEKAIEDSGDDRIGIFVHGAADPFEDAMYDAGEPAYYKECPTIIYSWPSVGTISAYHIVTANNDSDDKTTNATAGTGSEEGSSCLRVFFEDPKPARTQEPARRAR
ncbi:MAG: alpha/beta hydrolase [Candidatus Melainabacteria bacterium]|nr:alpha/beta hydrolase [Candidatus Melainabacteria bacterium]